MALASVAVKHIRAVVDTHVMKDIVDAVREGLEDVNVCEEGVRGLWNLLFYDAAQKKRGYDAHVLRLTVKVLTAHARHEDLGKAITRNCLFVIKEMAATCGSTSKKIKATHKKQIFDRTQEMGLSKVCLDHMQLYSGKVPGFPKCPRVQEAGCAALGWLNLEATQAYRAGVIKMGALDRAEWCIVHFERNPHVLRYARWLQGILLAAKAQYERDEENRREAEERQKMIMRMAKQATALGGGKRGKKMPSSDGEEAGDD